MRRVPAQAAQLLAAARVAEQEEADDKGAASSSASLDLRPSDEAAPLGMTYPRAPRQLWYLPQEIMPTSPRLQAEVLGIKQRGRNVFPRIGKNKLSRRDLAMKR